MITNAINANKMELAIPLKSLNITDYRKINLSFKWADNIKFTGDTMAFYLDGDTAPNERFHYIYNTNTNNGFIEIIIISSGCILAIGILAIVYFKRKRSERI